MAKKKTTKTSTRKPKPSSRRVSRRGSVRRKGLATLLAAYAANAISEMTTGHGVKDLVGKLRDIELSPKAKRALTFGLAGDEPEDTFEQDALAIVAQKAYDDEVLNDAGLALMTNPETTLGLLGAMANTGPAYGQEIGEMEAMGDIRRGAMEGATWPGMSRWSDGEVPVSSLLALQELDRLKAEQAGQQQSRYVQVGY